MDFKQLLNELDSVLEKYPSGVLSTYDALGWPMMRWMTVAMIRGQEGRLYSLASPASQKVQQIRINDQVGWMFGTPTKDRVINVQGNAKVLDAPDLISTVIEALGGNLGNFWKVNADPSELCVLETVIMNIDAYRPAEGTHEQAGA